MDKRKPAYDLSRIQKTVSKMTMTRSALVGAAQMGMIRQDMERVIKALTVKDFYKSTTSYHDHRKWMDVYHGRSDGHENYIKITSDAVTEFTCTSFKERDN